MLPLAGNDTKEVKKVAGLFRAVRGNEGGYQVKKLVWYGGRQKSSGKNKRDVYKTVKRAEKCALKESLSEAGDSRDPKKKLLNCIIQ